METQYEIKLILKNITNKSITDYNIVSHIGYRQFVIKFKYAYIVYAEYERRLHFSRYSHLDQISSERSTRAWHHSSKVSCEIDCN